MSWTSKLMVTASPTSRPPASRAAFQVRPKSFRLIRVVAESPIRVFPHGSFCAGLGPSTSKTTFRVTPRIVRSPLTRNVVFDVEGPSPAQKDPWGNTRIGLSVTTRISRKDFGLTWNAALEAGGLLVGDAVTINLDIQLIKER